MQDYAGVAKALAVFCLLPGSVFVTGDVVLPLISGRVMPASPGSAAKAETVQERVEKLRIEVAGATQAVNQANERAEEASRKATQAEEARITAEARVKETETLVTQAEWRTSQAELRTVRAMKAAENAAQFTQQQNLAERQKRDGLIAQAQEKIAELEAKIPPANITGTKNNSLYVKLAGNYAANASCANCGARLIIGRSGGLRSFVEHAEFGCPSCHVAHECSMRVTRDNKVLISDLRYASAPSTPATSGR